MSIYLLSKGWKLAADKRGKCRNIQLWDHPDHQHSRRGFFTNTQAKEHQEMLDKGHTCRCVPKEQPR